MTQWPGCSRDGKRSLQNHREGTAVTTDAQQTRPQGQGMQTVSLCSRILHVRSHTVGPPSHCRDGLPCPGTSWRRPDGQRQLNGLKSWEGASANATGDGPWSEMRPSQHPRARRLTPQTFRKPASPGHRQSPCPVRTLLLVYSPLSSSPVTSQSRRERERCRRSLGSSYPGTAGSPRQPRPCCLTPRYTEGWDFNMDLGDKLSGHHKHPHAFSRLPGGISGPLTTWCPGSRSRASPGSEVGSGAPVSASLKSTSLAIRPPKSGPHPQRKEQQSHTVGPPRGILLWTSLKKSNWPKSGKVTTQRNEWIRDTRAGSAGEKPG